jgi:predicted metalloendopeptidase
MLAEARLPSEDLHDASATWHPTSLGELDEKYPAFEWGGLFAELGLKGIDGVVITEPGYFQRFSQLVTEIPLDTWKAYFRWQLMRRYADHLGPDFSDAAFAFYGRRLMGNETQRSQDDRAGLATEGAFPELVGRLWVEKHVAPETVPSALALAEQIRHAFAERIEAAQWIEPSTKSVALEKLGSLLIKIGHPEHWTKVFPIDIDPDDIVGNLSRISTYRWQEERARLVRPVDRSRWLDVPQSTNAYYNRTTNELAIPAGYLRPPFFDPEAPMAENLGGIGTVVGHEMGHAFDNQGAQYDAAGRLRRWWSDADGQAFRSKTEALILQYDQYEALPERFVDGRMTVSENIGDLTGVAVAHAALVRSLENEPPAAREQSEKVFFEAFCRRLRAKYREPLLVRIVSADSHPPQKFRCLGPLSNFEPFYDAYGVKPGDGMYRPLVARVSIW